MLYFHCRICTSFASSFPAKIGKVILLQKYNYLYMVYHYLTLGKAQADTFLHKVVFS